MGGGYGLSGRVVSLGVGVRGVLGSVGGACRGVVSGCLGGRGKGCVGGGGSGGGGYRGRNCTFLGGTRLGLGIRGAIAEGRHGDGCAHSTDRGGALDGRTH